ncbi:hypothetical protein QM012_000815 [Aureobasidium pullulans]|uniref:Cryptic loci regulator 2 N-terminal domain-containing protein n=1 Tax=Aureobasidium pullulans TaxID=5580 RepID=A0ABR0TEX0_AURPU
MAIAAAPTPIDWANYYSDGIQEKCASRSSDRLSSYLKGLNNLVNKDKDITRTFGPAGVSFDALPNNYVLDTRPRSKVTKGQKEYDNYVYGHAEGKFRTSASFANHVVSILLDNIQGCQCEVCKPPQRLPKRAQIIHQAITTSPSSANDNMASSSPMMDVDDTEVPLNTGFDEDGTPNVFDGLMRKAKQGQHMNVAITEPLSMDWLIEQDLAELPAYLDSLETSTRWYPRLGEIVLVARNLKDDQLVKFDAKAGIYKIDDPKLGWVGLPAWEAVVVTQITKNSLAAGLLVQKQNTGSSDEDVFRVEPMPEIGNSDKPWSTRYRIVHLLNMRPFYLWQELMNGADVRKLGESHPTVRHALTAMSSISVVGRYHFSSNGKEARVYCKGLYVGAEFFVAGDLVRFSSPIHNNSLGKDVIRIKHICVSYNLEREPCSPSGVHITGVAYTTDPQHASGHYQRPIPFESLPVSGMRGYGLWYKMGEGDALIRIPYTKLLNRLMEDRYIKGMLGKPALIKAAVGGAEHLNARDHMVDITHGVEGVLAAREYSTQHDARINKEGQTWYLGENRVDQLDLAQINGQDVGHKARYGFESAPTPLQASHLKAMFRARSARQKGPKIGYTHSAPSMNRRHGVFATGMDTMENKIAQESLEDKQFRNDFTDRLMDKFEDEYIQRTTEADFDAFIS